MLLENSGKKFIKIVLAFVIVITLFVMLIFFANQKRAKEEKRLQEYQEIYVQEQEAIRNKEEREAIRIQKILEEIPGIVCWGDSLTAGAGSKVSYPKALSEKLVNEEYLTTNVINLGVGGENTNAIMARAGAIDIITVNSFTIPEKSTMVEVTFTGLNGTNLVPLKLNSESFKATISGIEGVLSHEKSDGKFYFKRNVQGEEVKVAAKTKIIHEQSQLYKDYIPVIFMGQNGGWNKEPSLLINQQQAILDKCGKNRGNFIIIGLTSGDDSSNAKLEAAMEKHWGEHYINLRKTLCDEKVLTDYGIKCTKEDTESMKKGIVPACVRSDEIHYNESGYRILANTVFEKMVSLEYVKK